MKLAFLRPITSCLLTSTYLISPFSSVEAINFEQQETNQSQFVAIARPYGNRQYDLLIIQQIPGQRDCWNETGSNPVKVDPLLLNFDFTGSCERSTDSNGYSIRIDGQDYGLNYLLRIVERNNELFLIGTSRQNSKQADVVIGRTNGIAPGLLKISLNPGWRFTKRAYQGKTLGHVYLTGERQAMASTNLLNAAIPTPRSSSTVNAPKPPKELTFTAEGTKPQPPRPILPQNKAEPVLPLPPVPSVSEPSNSQPPLPPPLPSVSANPSSRKTLSDTITDLSNPPATPRVAQAAPQKRYRVIGAASNSTQQKQLRSLYPDAFPTSYKGRSVWQIGVFSNQDKAQQALQSLMDAQIKGQIISIP
ncbi:DUF3747 domain-containing protein [Chroococcus sp. FPU101]|uniref:DUF3747 domain-containing protein n=1 Tax=Chroococcus sp. FPU101 TaxID=1974212 RepID=UPI001A8DA6B5|nr:DUF3747 domain-containing protein [Chroococcus sp. FPU101]GFE70620.1 hypothetical protein CFPU101_32300 [Chroococcus sp. FPU101]